MIVSRHARRSTLLRHVTKNPSPQVLVDPPLTNCDARNPFRIRFYENCRVSPGPLNIPTFKCAFCIPDASTGPANLTTFSDLSLFLSHSCALFCTYQGLNSFVFKRFRTLCQKPPGVGVPPTLSTRIKMTQATTDAISASDTRHRPHSHSTRGEVSPHTRFASHPCRFLVNYIDPILHRVGPAGRFPCSTQRPRS